MWIHRARTLDTQHRGDDGTDATRWCPMCGNPMSHQKNDYGPRTVYMDYWCEECKVLRSMEFELISNKWDECRVGIGVYDIEKEIGGDFSLAKKLAQMHDKN